MLVDSQIRQVGKRPSMPPLRCPLCGGKLADKQNTWCKNRIVATKAEQGDYLTKCHKCGKLIGLTAEN